MAAGNRRIGCSGERGASNGRMAERTYLRGRWAESEELREAWVVATALTRSGVVGRGGSARTSWQAGRTGPPLPISPQRSRGEKTITAPDRCTEGNRRRRQSPGLCFPLSSSPPSLLGAALPPRLAPSWGFLSDVRSTLGTMELWAHSEPRPLQGASSRATRAGAQTISVPAACWDALLRHASSARELVETATMTLRSAQSAP